MKKGLFLFGFRRDLSLGKATSLLANLPSAVGLTGAAVELGLYAISSVAYG